MASMPCETRYYTFRLEHRNGCQPFELCRCAAHAKRKYLLRQRTSTKTEFPNMQMEGPRKIASCSLRRQMVSADLAWSGTGALWLAQHGCRPADNDNGQKPVPLLCPLTFLHRSPYLVGDRHWGRGTGLTHGIPRGQQKECLDLSILTQAFEGLRAVETVDDNPTGPWL
jgi:hypothetical protein